MMGLYGGGVRNERVSGPECSTAPPMQRWTRHDYRRAIDSSILTRSRGDSAYDAFVVHRRARVALLRLDHLRRTRRLNWYRPLRVPSETNLSW